MTVYLVRHGSYDKKTGSLIERHKFLIRQTASEIKSKLNGLENITVYHSPAKRAYETAEILAETLPAELVECSDLGEYQSLETIAFINMLRETAILVTHFPNINDVCGKILQLGQWTAIEK